MKNIFVAMVIIALALFASLGSASAMCGVCTAKAMDVEAAETDKGQIINTACPVMGGEVKKDTAYTTVYKGKKIGFCCSDCVKAFDTDPQKYMAVVEKEIAAKNKDK